jgi:hypothetical protein
MASCWWGVNPIETEGDGQDDSTDMVQDDVIADDAFVEVPDTADVQDLPDVIDPADVPDGSDVPDTADTVDLEPDGPACDEGEPCDDGDDCTMLDRCDASGHCTGIAECTASPILGTGIDTRVAICVTDDACDSAVGGPGCSNARRPNLKSSWTDWEEGTDDPMAFCDTYYAYTSPPLDRGTEQCYAFFYEQTSTWFHADQDTPAECGPDHCSHDACGITF